MALTVMTDGWRSLVRCEITCCRSVSVINIVDQLKKKIAKLNVNRLMNDKIKITITHNLIA